MSNDRKHINIPIFIPHFGCPNQCVFCNQHAISGTCSFRNEDIIPIIDSILSTVGSDTTAEIAFFGGSFTGIDRGLMRYCLDTAESYVKKGLVSGIRMSTRPDYIDKEILDILSEYTISEVELGIQSFSDKVLSECRRGHTAEDTVRACRVLKEYGFPFVGQMMIGLPYSTLQDELYCAQQICSLGAAGSRIYPTLVFRDTELYDMTSAGKYVPLSLSEAVERSAAVLDVFVHHQVKCLRIGLCESDNLHSDRVFAGPNHPSMGELVRSELYFNRICLEMDHLKEGLSGAEVLIEVPTGDISLAVSQKKKNKLRIMDKYPIKSIRFLENPDLMRYNIKICMNKGV